MPVNGVCVQETVKQWLKCKQPADNSNKKYVFFAEAGQVSWHVFLLLLEVPLTWPQLLNS